MMALGSHEGITLLYLGRNLGLADVSIEPLSISLKKVFQAKRGKSCASTGPKVLGFKFVGELRCADFGLLSVDESVAVVEDGADDDEQEGADDEPSERLDLGQDDHQDELDRVHQRV